MMASVRQAERRERAVAEGKRAWPGADAATARRGAKRTADCIEKTVEAMLTGNVKKTEKLLPALVEQARENFPRDVNRQRAAALLSWINLAGVPGWCPAMVDRVEKLLRVAAVVAITLVAAAGSGWAAPTVVAQSRIAAGDGRRLATGKITITATAAFTAADGVRVETTPLPVPVTNGSFSVALEPNDTGVPSGTQYIAVWELDGAKPRTERWQVITSGSALAAGDVVASPITPAAGVQLSQILQSGATNGQAPVWSGSAWVPGNVSGGSSVVGASNMTGVAASQAPVSLALGLTAGHYAVRYYASVNTPCTAGAASANFHFAWTDASAARTLTTGALVMGSAQQTQGYLSGTFEIWAGAGTNVTYLSAWAGGCLTGAATYDAHVTVEAIQ